MFAKKNREEHKNILTSMIIQTANMITKSAGPAMKCLSSIYENNEHPNTNLMWKIKRILLIISQMN
jgi:hypothetical protein